METINVRFLNRDGGGFVEDVTVPVGTTVGQLFTQKLGEYGEPDRFIIRRNSQPTAAEDILAEGDIVTLTPVKITGN